MKEISRLCSVIAAIAVMTACSEKEGAPGIGAGINTKGVTITFDKSVIKADGNDVVTFKAYYDGRDVSDQAKFYNIVDGKPKRMDGSTFVATQVGSYSFWATCNTGQSERVTISAISKDIPSAASDNSPSNTSFVRRTFFNQYTAGTCIWCPYMTHLLHKTMKDGYEDKVVLASVRSGESGFAQLSNPSSGLPYLHIDYSMGYDHQMASQAAVDRLRNLIDEVVEKPAVAGISANTKYYEEDGQILVKVAVKAAQAGEYNVGLWLMQDNVYVPQSFNDEANANALDGTWKPGSPLKNPYSYHNNTIRVAESRYLGAHVGYPLGMLQAGQTAEWIFLVNVNLGEGIDKNDDGKIDHNDGSWWAGWEKVNLDDLHFAAFVTNHKGNVYTVVNAIDFPYNGSVAFEYK